MSEKEFIDKIVNYIIKGDIKFPLKCMFIKNDKEMFANLQKYKSVIDKSKYEIPYISFSTKLFTEPKTKNVFKFDGEFITFISKPSDYEEMDMIADLFTEDQRLRANIMSSPSPMEMWQTKQGATKIIEHVISKKQDINTHNLREAIYSKSKEATQFKPTLAISVVSFLTKDIPLTSVRWLDISAGWGDRLIAAMAMGIDKYVAFDPNIHLKKGHSSMIKTFAPKKNAYEVRYEPFQTGHLEDTEVFDIVFTSPPFFNYEIYSTHHTQSVSQYSQFDNWMKNFLFVSLNKAWNHLTIDGHMAIHISDIPNITICEPMLLFIQAELPGAKYMGVVSSLAGAKKNRPIWVFKKLLPLDEDTSRKQKAKKELATFIEM